MSSDFGEHIKISIFGESHGAAIGVVIDGLPAGETIDTDRLQAFLSRRAPGQNAYTTRRKEGDVPKFLSGVVDQKTCGSPLCAVIENFDMHPGDYNQIRDIPRPSHADYPAYLKYNGMNDVRGGGHFSGRLTAPLCIAGSICLQMLERRGISIGAHILSIASINDEPFDSVNITKSELLSLSQKEFPVLSEDAGEKMKKQIADAAKEDDSVGGVIECCALDFPVGIGEPMFDGIENRLSSALFGIPAVKGVEFGAGFSSSLMRGSQNNDPYCYKNGKILTKTNHHGGIIGGIFDRNADSFPCSVQANPFH